MHCPYSGLGARVRGHSFCIAPLLLSLREPTKSQAAAEKQSIFSDTTCTIISLNKQTKQTKQNSDHSRRHDAYGTYSAVSVARALADNVLLLKCIWAESGKKKTNINEMFKREKKE